MLRFADFLFDEKDYLRAIVEYQRYLSSGSGQGSDEARVQLKIGLCFRLANDFPQAISTFQRILDTFPGSDTAEDSYLQLAYSLFLAGRYYESEAFIDGALHGVHSEDSRLALTNLKGADYLFEKQWQRAEELLRSVSGETAGNPLTASLRDIAAQGQRLTRRSPLLAGTLSALVPGTGRIYAGRKGDGVLSLVTFAASSWQAYSGFHRNGVRSVKGWIYGSFGAFLYAGNVYGSAVAVRIFNERSEQKLLDRAGISVSVLFR